jgi:hypothetical protein
LTDLIAKTKGEESIPRAANWSGGKRNVVTMVDKNGVFLRYRQRNCES